MRQITNAEGINSSRSTILIKEYYSVEEVSRFLHISERTVRELTHREENPLPEAHARGDRIHLGGHEVLVLEKPGHTVGGLSFLNPRERLPLSGGVCWFAILLALAGNTDRERTTCLAVAASAEKIVRLKGEFDRHCYGAWGSCRRSRRG